MTCIAALICILVILFLFWTERKNDVGVSKAIWIPFIWMFFAGSRQLSQWLRLGAPIEPSNMKVEGHPLNASVFLVLIIAGILILWRRKLNWKRLWTQNAWICLLLIFGAISILWSDYRFISFKRFIKSLGPAIMAMVILSEENPYKALAAILKRLVFLILPLSVLFIKYYPHLGIMFTRSGKMMYTGATLHKNSLGQICLIFGIYFFWSLLFNFREEIKSESAIRLSAYLIILPMFAWFLYKVNSATSLACLIVVVCLFLFTRLPWIYQRPYRILVLCVAGIVFFTALQLLFKVNVKGMIIAMLDRRENLTDRTLIWEYLRFHAGNPWVGVGYESFWLGSRLEQAWEKLGDDVFHAHNGYLEVYINLGYIGLALVVGNILSGLFKAWKRLFVNFPAGILRLSFIIVAVLYNYTETSFSGVSNMWLLFWLGVIDPPLKDTTRGT